MTKSSWDYTGQGLPITGRLDIKTEMRIKWVQQMAERLVKAKDDKDKLRQIATEYAEHGMHNTARQIRIRHNL